MASDCSNGSALGGARVVLSTGSLYNWALDRVFGIASAAGYDGVELLVDARMDSYDVPYLRTLSERWRMPILSVHTPFALRVVGWPEAPEARVEHTVRLAEALGAETVVAHAPLRWQVGHLRLRVGQRSFERLLVMPWASAEGARYARWLQDDMPALQAQSCVRIAVENMPAHRVWGRAIRLYRYAGAEELGRFAHLVLDTTHWGTCGVEPVDVYRVLKERIRHVHLSNYDGHEHRMPYKGNLRLEALVEQMGHDGFGGLLVIEVEPWAVAEGDWREARVLSALQEAARRTRELLGGRPSHSHTAVARGAASSAVRAE